MSAPLLSIIIPVYNVEEYIKECLDSVRVQTFSDFEVIMVDDGSTDSSGKICDEYSSLDHRFKTIHKTNGGVSTARNTAIDNASGKYLTMLDPDDSIAPETYANVIYMEQNPMVDILQFPYVSCYPDGKQELLSPPPCLLTGKDNILLNWWEGNILHFANLNKIFKQTVFENLRYRIGHVSEDTYLVADFIERCNQVYISNQGCYYYKIRGNSLTSHYTFSKHIDLFEAHLRTYKKITEYPLLKPVRIIAYSRLFRRLISARLSSPESDIKPYLKEVQRYMPHWSDILANKDKKTTFWIIAVKITGASLFTRIFCRYLKASKKT